MLIIEGGHMRQNAYNLILKVLKRDENGYIVEMGLIVTILTQLSRIVTTIQ